MRTALRRTASISMWESPTDTRFVTASSWSLFWTCVRGVVGIRTQARAIARKLAQKNEHVAAAAGTSVCARPALLQESMHLPSVAVAREGRFERASRRDDVHLTTTTFMGARM
eukprot:52536-Prymnesium_polylepis.1